MEKVVRSSQGLRDMLFDELDRLRSGEVSPQRVNVLAKASSQIISTVRLEMDLLKYASGLGKKDTVRLSPVEMGQA